MVFSLFIWEQDFGMKDKLYQTKTLNLILKNLEQI